jgi:hypothetical protein
MKETRKLFVAYIGCIALGLTLGFAYVKSQSTLNRWLSFKAKPYESGDIDLQNRVQAVDIITLQWSQLLPDSNKLVLAKYQQRQATSTELVDSIILSIKASTDKDYRAAMLSTNSVGTFDGQAVSIAGFIVPIDYAEDQSLSNIFIVPYFGACLHFPPPPPNQIIFAQLGKGFTDFEISQAYRLNGILRQGLFEDPLGTSAYILDVVSIEPYYDDPDDFRLH